MGRPKIEIDWKEFEQLCFLQCSLEDIAYWFKCSKKTIERNCYKHYGESFVPVFEKKCVGGKIKLRRNLVKLSEKNVAAAIFLAKNWLGMSDKQEVQENVSITDKTVRELSNEQLQQVIAAARSGNGHIPGKGRFRVTIPSAS